MYSHQMHCEILLSGDHALAGFFHEQDARNESKFLWMTCPQTTSPGAIACLARLHSSTGNVPVAYCPLTWAGLKDTDSGESSPGGCCVKDVVITPNTIGQDVGKILLLRHWRRSFSSDLCYAIQALKHLV